MCLFYVLNLVCDKLRHCIWNYPSTQMQSTQSNATEGTEGRQQRNKSVLCLLTAIALKRTSDCKWTAVQHWRTISQPVIRSFSVTGTVSPLRWSMEIAIWNWLGCRNSPWRLSKVRVGGDKDKDEQTSAIQSRDQLMALLCIYFLLTSSPDMASVSVLVSHNLWGN